MISWKTNDVVNPFTDVEGHPFKDVEKYAILTCDQELFKNELYYSVNPQKRFTYFRLVQNNKTGMTFIVSSSNDVSENEMMNIISSFKSKYLTKRTVIS